MLQNRRKQKKLDMAQHFANLDLDHKFITRPDNFQTNSIFSNKLSGKTLLKR